MLPEEARLTLEVLAAALSGDPDPTPRLGNSRGVAYAWARFCGDMVHGVECPAKVCEVVGAARSGDETCSCGLRSLVLALEGGEA